MYPELGIYKLKMENSEKLITKMQSTSIKNYFYIISINKFKMVILNFLKGWNSYSNTMSWDSSIEYQHCYIMNWSQLTNHVHIIARYQVHPGQEGEHGSEPVLPQARALPALLREISLLQAVLSI